MGLVAEVFTLLSLLFLCKAKAQDFVKYNANEFANSQNHINEFVNIFTSCYYNCK
ncbi:hypothetical protein [Campylobacter troglodytis]|uniref:hypothetical protein n=1 Tax=Campylobacter troglodytis TaxID=654363 RepID=UPI00163BFA72|nr:hypothetical protein [Campylobacter troglodytis]